MADASADGGNEVIEAPDVLGEEGRVDVLVQALHATQQQRFLLEVQQVSAGAGDTDPILNQQGLASQLPDGTIVTYAMQRGALADAERRLTETYSGLITRARERLNASG